MAVARGMRGLNNEVMGGMRLVVSLISIVASTAVFAACKDATGKQGASTSGSAGSGSGSGSASVLAQPSAGSDALDIPEPIETTWDKTQAYRADVLAERKAKDLAKGDQQDEEWVPAEFKAGAARWKDVGVYVDGKPMGFLTLGELPIALKPTWVKDKVSAEKRPGTDDPGWRWSQQRFYRFDQYLTAIGVDVRKIKELHVYGPKFSETNISTAKDLLGPKGKEFMFRFGANVGGKPISQVPPGFGNSQVGRQDRGRDGLHQQEAAEAGAEPGARARRRDPGGRALLRRSDPRRRARLPRRQARLDHQAPGARRRQGDQGRRGRAAVEARATCSPRRASTPRRSSRCGWSATSAARRSSPPARSRR